jgi:hypothetical protein
MKKISFRIIAVALSMVAAATTTTTFAQNRPDCLTSGTPGVCFADGEALNWFNLCGTHVTIAVSGDVDGSWALWTFKAEASDFQAYIGNNGQPLFHANATDADLWVCPATAGGLDCLFQYIDTCVVPAGMLTGTGRFTGTEIPPGGGACVAASGDGTVKNQGGQSFKVNFLWVVKPAPPNQCVEVKHELSITPE